MGLISPGGENLLDFLELRQVLSTYDGQFDSWVGKIHWRRDRLLTPVFLGFPCGSAGKESTCNVGNLGSIPGLGRSPGVGNGYPLQYSGLENSINCIVHGFIEWDMTERLSLHFLTLTTCLNTLNLFPLSANWG